MKKVVFPIIAVLFISLLSIIAFSSDSSMSNENQGEDIDPLLDEESTLQGYYFNGYIDVREPLESFEESTTYMYYMNNYLEAYINRQTSVIQSNEQDDAYSQYFDQLDNPIYPVSFQNKYDLKNGEYVHVTFKGGIRETYPAQIGEIIDVEVVNLTN